MEYFSLPQLPISNLTYGSRAKVYALKNIWFRAIQIYPLCKETATMPSCFFATSFYGPLFPLPVSIFMLLALLPISESFILFLMAYSPSTKLFVPSADIGVKEVPIFHRAHDGFCQTNEAVCRTFSARLGDVHGSVLIKYLTSYKSNEFSIRLGRMVHQRFSCKNTASSLQRAFSSLWTHRHQVWTWRKGWLLLKDVNAGATFYGAVFK